MHEMLGEERIICKVATVIIVKVTAMVESRRTVALVPG
jgi:hypothetical protein